MRILLTNPNTTSTMTDDMAAVARRVANADTEIVTSTAPSGFPYISCRAEAQVAGAVVLDTIAAQRSKVDAVIIAAFGDPGLDAARELFDLPVVGVAEAAMASALMLGERFAIVTFTPAMSPWYLEAVRRTGLERRFAGLRTPDVAMGAIASVRETLREPLLAEVRAAVAQDGADVVILGGGPLAGLARGLPDPGAVLIDPVEAAVKQAEALVTLSPGGAHAGSFARPPAKAGTGLPQALSDYVKPL
ncbi:MAG: aspartate/glutamate racemase family protein [Pseudomonadota bacterium]